MYFGILFVVAQCMGTFNISQSLVIFLVGEFGSGQQSYGSGQRRIEGYGFYKQGLRFTVSLVL